jgi:hypothetical protein
MRLRLLVSWNDMANLQTVLSMYQFKRTGDMIQVFNENSYLMAQYSERTGTVHWQRVLIASQRELIEQWLRERFPATAGTTTGTRPAAASQVAAVAPPSRLDRRRQAPSPGRRRASSPSAR